MEEVAYPKWAGPSLMCFIFFLFLIGPHKSVMDSSYIVDGPF